MSDTPDFHGLVGLFEETHRALQARAARSVDVALVVRNWLFGHYIVEYEQGGADRAQLYSKALIDRLATALSGKGLRGIFPTNLRCSPWVCFCSRQACFAQGREPHPLRGLRRGDPGSSAAGCLRGSPLHRLSVRGRQSVCRSQSLQPARQQGKPTEVDCARPRS